ncbi:hypothetical protein DICA2_C16710 [Diutina catenulata]
MYFLWFLWGLTIAYSHQLTPENPAVCADVRVVEGNPVGISLNPSHTDPIVVMVSPAGLTRELEMPTYKDYKAMIANGTADSLFENNRFRYHKLEGVKMFSSDVFKDSVSWPVPESAKWCVYAGSATPGWSLKTKFIHSHGYLAPQIYIKYQMVLFTLGLYMVVLGSYVAVCMKHCHPSAITTDTLYWVLGPAFGIEFGRAFSLWVSNNFNHQPSESWLYANCFHSWVKATLQTAWLWLFCRGSGTITTFQRPQKVWVAVGASIPVIIGLIVSSQRAATRVMVNHEYISNDTYFRWFNRLSTGGFIAENAAWGVVYLWMAVNFIATLARQRSVANKFRYFLSVLALAVPIAARVLLALGPKIISYKGDIRKELFDIEGLYIPMAYLFLVETLANFVPPIWLYFMWVRGNRGLDTQKQTQ